MCFVYTGHHAGGGYNSHGYGHGGTMGGGTHGTHGGTRGGTQGGGSRGTQGGGAGSYMVPVTFVAYAEVEIDEDEGYGSD